MLYNKRADGEKLQIDGAKENHSAVAFEGGGSASFDISTIGATGFTAIVGLDGSSQDFDKAKFSVLCDGSEIAASSELTKGNAEKLTADIPAGAKSIELKAEGSGLAVFGDAAVTFPFSHNGYADMTVMRIEQQINDAANPLKINEDIKIGSDTFDKGFAVYPQSADNLGQVSELYFDVSGMDAKTFTAKVGLNNADNTNGASVQSLRRRTEGLRKRYGHRRNQSGGRFGRHNRCKPRNPHRLQQRRKRQATMPCGHSRDCLLTQIKALI